MLYTGLWFGTAVTKVRDWPTFGVYFAVHERIATAWSNEAHHNMLLNQ